MRWFVGIRIDREERFAISPGVERDLLSIAAPLRRTHADVVGQIRKRPQLAAVSFTINKLLWKLGNGFLG